jgi:hypothetical protein
MKTEAQNLLGMSEVKGKSKAFQHASDAYTSILWAKREVELDPSVLVKGTPEEFEKLASLAQSAVNKVHDALLRKK